MSLHDDGREPRQSVPSTGPWSTPPSAPPRLTTPTPPDPEPLRRWRPSLTTIAFAVLLFGGIGIRAYQDLSTPEAWSYWKDLYVAPSLSAETIDNPDPGLFGGGRKVLAISGKIGAASATWLREQLDQAKLQPGDIVLLSSPGGNLSQSMIMGEVIRARGLSTAVGTADANGRIKPSFCASACVTAYAGGKIRLGIDGSRLGVHRFTSPKAGDDPVASAQRTMGFVLSYMTRMGVSSSVVEAMSATDKIRWLGSAEAQSMNLVTDAMQRS
ncbi:MAG: hypothetical protein NT113_12855 [Hyphomicrobiales bacterium]|nr:hypothetical protein [Hyphomicrobiales bacterium]